MEKKGIDGKYSTKCGTAIAVVQGWSTGDVKLTWERGSDGALDATLKKTSDTTVEWEGGARNLIDDLIKV